MSRTLKVTLEGEVDDETNQHSELRKNFKIFKYMSNTPTSEIAKKTKQNKNKINKQTKHTHTHPHTKNPRNTGTLQWSSIIAQFTISRTWHFFNILLVKFYSQFTTFDMIDLLFFIVLFLNRYKGTRQTDRYSAKCLSEKVTCQNVTPRANQQSGILPLCFMFVGTKAVGFLLSRHEVQVCLFWWYFFFFFFFFFLHKVCSHLDLFTMSGAQALFICMGYSTKIHT